MVGEGCGEGCGRVVGRGGDKDGGGVEIRMGEGWR